MKLGSACIPYARTWAPLSASLGPLDVAMWTPNHQPAKINFLRLPQTIHFCVLCQLLTELRFSMLGFLLLGVKFEFQFTSQSLSFPRPKGEFLFLKFSKSYRSLSHYFVGLFLTQPCTYAVSVAAL